MISRILKLILKKVNLIEVFLVGCTRNIWIKSLWIVLLLFMGKIRDIHENHALQMVDSERDGFEFPTKSFFVISYYTKYP